jgi:hypothetical protein
MQKLVAILSVAVLFACNSNQSANPEKKEISRDQLIGEWNNISIKVDIHSKKNTDSSDTFVAARGEWEKVVKIKPIRTFLRADSTWNSAHYTLTDTLFYDPSGKWWLEGDSIVLEQIKPSPDITKYLLRLNGDTASFTTVLDWDMDGKKDDAYFGEQVKRK